MNGRVYDYNLGRFLSVDPLIQDVGNSQGMNPYSYIMNNPLAGTDPTGYAIEEETKDIKEYVTGSRIKKKTGTKTTSTVTDDATGEVTNVTSTTVMNNGSFTSNSVNYSNGKAESAIVAGGNFKAGVGASASYDIGSQAEISKSSPTTPSEGRSVSGTDSDGNVYNWRQTSIYVGGPDGAWGAMRGVHNSGQGYDDWTSAGGDKSLMDHPFTHMLLGAVGESIPTIVSLATLRLAKSNNLFARRLGNFLQGFSDGYKGLTATKRKEFDKHMYGVFCGAMIFCANKVGYPMKSPIMPSNPPSIRNLNNYLHRWYNSEPPIMLQGVAKK